METATWKITIINPKTNISRSFFSSSDEPKFDRALGKVEDSTPIAELPDTWEIKVSRLRLADGKVKDSTK